MLFFTDIKTGIQQQLEWFLDGKNLPIEVGAMILRDLSDDKSDPEHYVDILAKVKGKLNDRDILINNNVLYVDYESGVDTSKPELATLVRMINLRYSGQFTVILNHEEVLYVPSDYKYTTSHNEMMKDLEALVKNNRNQNGYKKRSIKAGKEVQEDVTQEPKITNSVVEQTGTPVATTKALDIASIKPFVGAQVRDNVDDGYIMNQDFRNDPAANQPV